MKINTHREIDVGMSQDQGDTSVLVLIRNLPERTSENIKKYYENLFVDWLNIRLSVDSAERKHRDQRENTLTC